jgi:hypothetical protein
MVKLFKPAALAALALGAFVATNAQAGVVVFDDFEGYGNASILNFGKAPLGLFNQLTVEGTGNVDLVKNPDYGIVTPFGSFSVDLDGSTPNDGALLRTGVFNFNAGDLVRLDFDLSGNQRGGADDEWSYGLETTGLTNFLNVTVQNAIGPGFINVGNLGPGFAVASGQAAISSGSPWTHYGISFVAGNSGSLTAFVATSSDDNVGPILDNFQLSIGSVPEPSSWVMMILRFGGIGGLVRARRPAQTA